MARADQGTLAADDMPNAPKVDVAPETTPENVAPERVYAGTFKDPDALEKGYAELKGKLDAQGGELGAIRAQNKELQAQLGASAQPQEEQQAPTVDYEGVVANLAAQYEAGDIDFPTYSKELVSLTAQFTEANAQSQVDKILNQANEQFNQTLQERDDEIAVAEFHKQYPDFASKQASGAFNDIKAANPLFDDVNAYFALVAQEAKAAGMAEQARIESGSKTAGKVLADPGTAMQTPKKRPTTEAEVKASMLASIV